MISGIDQVAGLDQWRERLAVAAAVLAGAVRQLQHRLRLCVRAPAEAGKARAVGALIAETQLLDAHRRLLLQRPSPAIARNCVTAASAVGHAIVTRALARAHPPLLVERNLKRRARVADIPYSTALIVGAGPGISASLARALAGAGLKVGLAARNTDKLAVLAAETGAATFAADASDLAAVAKLFDEVDA